ncbi:MAG TPA: cytochrome c [Acidobacteriaceae bacterium]|jgi:cytochrome c5|nr:cytochrome c [Acidobacteriaceae bacterium]
MKHLSHILLLLGSMAMTAAIVTGQTPRHSGAKAHAASAQTGAAATPDRGQQVFEQNCSRCHNPPEGFPPTVSGTIAMHMRVRAGLSEADYKALLRYLNS